jgi:RNA recognition motif. (a.k.a. RRM, RBD, or RNP domain)
MQLHSSEINGQRCYLRWIVLPDSALSWCSPYHIFVSRLTQTTSVNDLRDMWGSFGLMRNCEIDEDIGGIIERYGIIQFERFESYLAALDTIHLARLVLRGHNSGFSAGVPSVQVPGGAPASRIRNKPELRRGDYFSPYDNVLGDNALPVKMIGRGGAGTVYQVTSPSWR